jgi:hypothetical protein
MRHDAPPVSGDNHTELPYVTTEPGFDSCEPPADNEGWVEARRQAFEPYISQLFVDEASAGDLAAARERLKVIEGLPLLDITPDATEFASDMLATRIIPRKAATDAAHIAIAAVHGMDFLVTWNSVHIANAALAKALVAVCRKHAWECPVICTPEELFGE